MRIQAGLVWYMKKLFFTPLVCVLLTVSPAKSHTPPKHSPIEGIVGKYQELSAEAAYIKANGVPVVQSTRFIEPEDNVVEDYGNLRQIALVRHGEPDLVKTGKFSFEQASRYLADYDSVGIVVPERSFFHVGNGEDTKVFASPVNRARATAQYLFGSDEDVTFSRDFREFERSLGKRGPKLRMPIKFWTTLARVKWLMGAKGHGIESFAEAKARANKAAQTLAEASEENSKVVLVAHGFLNRYVKEDLEEMGWRVVRDGGTDYFATTILVKLEEEKNDQKLAFQDN